MEGGRRTKHGQTFGPPWPDRSAEVMFPSVRGRGHPRSARGYTPAVRKCFGLVFLLLTTGITCAHEPARAPLATTEEPQDGGTLLRRLEDDVNSLNPIRTANVSERYVAQYLFTPLVYLDAQMHPVPGIARTWSISDDRLTYQFILDARATFSDGSRVRASDVAFTLERIHDEREQAHNGSEFEHFDFARAINDTTVQVRFKKALATQMTRFADVPVLPEHVYARRTFRDDYNEPPIGSGPYTLLRREHDLIVLQRREDYWREKPPIHRVTFKVITDYTTASLALKRGDVDESYIPSFDWKEEHNDPALNRTLNFRQFYTTNYTCVVWNLHRPFLQDVRVRRALAMSVSMEKAVMLYYGAARTITGPFTPNYEGYNTAVHALPYAPGEAAKLLAAAGWIKPDHGEILHKDGKPFRIVMRMVGAGLPFAQLIQAELLKIGVQVDIDSMGLAAAQQRVERGDYDAVCFRWTLDPNLDLYPLFHSSQLRPNGWNIGFYANKEVDRLLEQARTEPKPKNRRAYCQRIHQIIAGDQPYSFYYQSASNWGTNKRVHGVETSPLLGLFLWYPGELGWWIAGEKQ
jgi:peptide/nickel transport system substrate-binding protein